MKRFKFVFPAIGRMWRRAFALRGARSAALKSCATFCLSVCLVAARPQYGGTLRIQTRAAIRSLDPAVATTDRDEASLAARLRPLVFETLVRIDPTGGVRPMLAISWESDSGGARWRFHLRPGITLHDGSPLEAWQVAAALRTTATTWGVSTDGDVVIVEPKSAEADVPWALADPRYAVAVRRSASELVGSGPFRIDRLESGRVTLKAHDAHWAGRPFVDAVQVDLQRGLNAQLSDLESGRADIVELQPADARRVTERGLHVAATRARDLLVLVFEPHRAESSSSASRKLFAGALDRAAVAGVLLQGRGEPARSLLPTWLAGYAPDFVAAAIPRSTRPAVTALPAEQRAVTLRVDPADAVARAVAERIAVDAREVGFTVTIQAPAGLAPRPDVRLLRVTADSTSPDRALARLSSDLGSRVTATAPKDAMPTAASQLDNAVRFEGALLQDSTVVPVVRVPDLYGVGDAVDVWDGEVVGATGRWNVANVWLRPAAPRARP
jgi:peptide/nickel transport system substrate-binding protein